MITKTKTIVESHKIRAKPSGWRIDDFPRNRWFPRQYKATLVDQFGHEFTINATKEFLEEIQASPDSWIEMEIKVCK